jgi:hypothetical protein
VHFDHLARRSGLRSAAFRWVVFRDTHAPSTIETLSTEPSAPTIFPSKSSNELRKFEGCGKTRGSLLATLDLADEIEARCSISTLDSFRAKLVALPQRISRFPEGRCSLLTADARSRRPARRKK